MGPYSAVSIVFSIITNCDNPIVPVTDEGLSLHMVIYAKIQYTRANIGTILLHKRGSHGQ